MLTLLTMDVQPEKSQEVLDLGGFSIDFGGISVHFSPYNRNGFISGFASGETLKAPQD